MLEVQNLTKIYQMGRISIRALSDVSYTVQEGTMVCVTGRSGSGKSTMLRQLGLLDYPSRGRIFFNGIEATRLSVNARAKLRLNYLGYVFQEYALLQELTALENVFLPGMMLDKNQDNYKKRAAELLELVGLSERRRHHPKELSGGEQQRVAIARALINNPRILFADEPCANLDTVSSKLIMETLVRLNHEMKLTIIFVSHEPNDKKYATHNLTLSDGRLISESNASENPIL